MGGEEARQPVAVKRTHRGGDIGIVRIMFPGRAQSEHENLAKIFWDEFFRQFEESKLALLDEEDSLFSNIAGRDTVERREHGSGTRRAKAALPRFPYRDYIERKRFLPGFGTGSITHHGAISDRKAERPSADRAGVFASQIWNQDWPPSFFRAAVTVPPGPWNWCR